VSKRFELRASDTDRDRTIAELREHAVAGRLTLEEFSERTERAIVARTLQDLAALAADLPRPNRPAGRLSQLPLQRLRLQGGLYVATNATLVGAWFVSNSPGGVGAGPEPFWPAWPMLGVALSWGLFLVVRALRAREEHGVQLRLHESSAGPRG
jgi:hypothetical protein